jgi:hypothetical protein
MKKIKEVAKRHDLIKLFLLVLTFVVYFTFVARRFGLHSGLFISLLTWSFFVFCTPLAEAGFVISFPLRLFANIRMMYSQIGVWIVAFLLNLFAFIFNPGIYDNTLILKLFYHILIQPFPYWGIIILSAVGTIFSTFFGDELFDMADYKNRAKHSKRLNAYWIIVFVSLISIIVALYDFLLNKMGINIHL